MLNQDSQQIVARFFEAIEILKRDKKIRGLKTFTNKYGINRGNFYKLQGNILSNIFQPSWLAYLVRDFGVSSEWLLLGSGNFYSETAL